MEIITVADLTNYLGSATPAPSNAEFIVELVNDLVTEAWAEPVDPVPSRVKLIALEVAARPARNPKGLSSWTRSVDDASRTERLSDSAARTGVFLTDEEAAYLSGALRRRRNRYGTIRLRIGV